MHKVENEVALVLHLRQHFDLKNEAPSREFRWIQVDLDEINRRLLVGLCRAIAVRAKNVAFGFTYLETLYFSDLGDYISQPVGHGLTCATFVMAVFAKFKIPLLVLVDWPRRPDDPLWQRWQVGEVSRSVPVPSTI